MEQLQSTALEGFWLSPQQKRVWLLSRGARRFVCQCAVLIEGPLDPRRLQAVLTSIVQSHEVLRTTFSTVSGMDLPLQVIAEDPLMSLRTVDLISEPSERQAALETILRTERSLEFDLEQGPVVRFCQVSLAEESHALVITLSALCADAASLENLVAGISRAYLVEHGIQGTPAEPVQYVQFSEWQNEILSDESEENEPGHRFWRLRVDAADAMPRLPFEKGGAPEGPAPEVLRFPLGTELSTALSEWTTRAGVGEAAVLLGAWWMTLCRITGQESLPVSVLCHGRAYEEMRGALGLYERWPALGRDLRIAFGFSEVIRTLERELSEVGHWQEFYSTEAASTAGGGFGFDFALRSTGPARAGRTRFLLTRLYSCTDWFRLRLSAADTPDGIEISLYFDPGLYEEAHVLRVAESFMALLGDGLASPETPASELAVLGAADRARLAEWNRTFHEIPELQPLHLLFSAQAARTPDSEAVSFEGESLSYGELEKRANRIARLLIDLGIGIEDRVALCLDRSVDVIPAVLGILKAGAAYVPLDPWQPVERLAGMLADSGMAVVLSQAGLSARVPAGDWQVILLDDAALAPQDQTPPKVAVRVENLAYVIYTSGSTGRPKGTLIEQRSVVNLGLALERAIYSQLGDNVPLRVTLNAPLSFDASVKQWIQLLRGYTLLIVPEEVRVDGEAFLAWLARNRADLLDCTPSQLRLLLDSGLDSGGRPYPRAILVGGEAIDPALWARLGADRERFYFNVYGPTECTVDTTACRVEPDVAQTIGGPLANIRVHVLDGSWREVPIGVAGELCVAGAGLARGYAEHPALTAERFVPDPFSNDPGARLYRTGDRACFRDDGRLEFQGRLDHQVKVRGIRVELGEIEAALARHPGVAHAAVLLREDQPGRPRLVGYVAPRHFPAGGAERHQLPNGLRLAHQNRNETEYLYREIFENRCYVRHGLSLPDDACVLDVGANIGMFTLFVHEECERPRVYAFEPLPAIFGCLAANCGTYIPDVKLFRFGLSDRERSEKFTYYPRYSMMSGLAAYARPDSEVEVVRRFLQNQIEQSVAGADALLAEAGDLLADRFRGEETEVQLRRLSDVLREEQIERVDLLKVDVQRAELDVLGGIDDEHWLLIDQVVLEVHDASGEQTEGNLERLRDLLETRGYRVIVEQDDLLAGTDRYNVYAVRQGRETRVNSRTAGPSRLAARAAGSLSVEGLRDFARRWLPESMLPSDLILLEELPYTRHGKVDRSALPAPEEITAAARPVLAPRTPVEEALVGLFAEILGTDRVGADESFFDLGGHSLLATQLMSRVRDSFQIELPLRTLFEEPTVVGLGQRIETVLLAGSGIEMPPIGRVSRERPLPLSFAQQRLWFLHRLDPNSPAYHNPKAIRIQGPLDVGAVVATLAEIVRRHEVLRTAYPETADGPVQRIHPATERPSVAMVDLSGLTVPVRDGLVRDLFRAAARRPFDLTREASLRMMLLRLDAQDHALLLTLHHIACDAWSLTILEQEVSVLYESCRQGRTSPLPELPIQYADYASWQREWLRGETLDRQIVFWRDQLAGAPPVLELPLDRPRPPVQNHQGSRLGFALDESLSQALGDLGLRRASTLFMVVLAGFQSLLARWSGQWDICLGTPIAGRSRLETEKLIGFFVNTLVLRSQIHDGQSFHELLRQVREMALRAYAHQDLPFELLVDEVEAHRDLAYSPLFQVSFALQVVAGEEGGGGDLAFASVATDVGSVKFDLSLSLVSPERGGIHGVFEYRTDLFDRTSILRLSTHFQRLLEGIVAAPEAPLSDLPLLSSTERHQLLVEWGSGLGAPVTGLVPDRLQSIFERHADADALVWGDERLTYRALSDWASRLARRLGATALQRGEPVGVLLERSPVQVAAILGVWKAGGAFLPLDPALPSERLEWMLADAGVRVLLTERRMFGALSGADMETVIVDDAVTEAGGEVPLAATANQLAYVIYTSGSTGRPKGVMVEHGQLAATLGAAQRRFRFTAEDRMPALAPFSFDIFLFELLSPLLAGGCCVLVPPLVDIGIEKLVEQLTAATRIHAVPSLLRQVSEAVGKRVAEDGWRSLRTLFTGGDAVPSALLADLRTTFPDADLVVLYGPTEATVFCTVWEVAARVRPDGSLLGRPLDGVILRLCDTRGEPVPAGAPGEIWIGGQAVSRGYLARPDLTAERFPPAAIPEGARFYRSGDLARWRSDGTLEFLGRVDHQVKVRGFRIELGEVEAALLAEPEVREAAVLARRDGGRDLELVAYLVPTDSAIPDTRILRDRLARRLPDYMVPAAFVALPELPRTPHGKLDRKALSETSRERRATAEHVPPQGAVEEVLATIWAAILRLDQVGARDSFFELGGHSLLATQIVSRVREILGVEVPLRAVFEHPTVEGLARRIEELRRSTEGLSLPPLVPVARDRPLPLSFSQQRLWFLDQLEPGGTTYNVPLAQRLHGRLDERALAAAFSELVLRHEVLRTRFAEVDGQAVQVIVPGGLLPLPILDLSALPEEEREKEAKRLAGLEAETGFDLARGPVLRIRLLRLAEEDRAILLTMHHIASDGWSVGILMRELGRLYEAFRANEPSPLSSLPVQYADYAVWQRDWLRGQTLAAELEWWRERLRDAPVALELPTDRPRPAVASRRGASRPLTLDADLSRSLGLLGRTRGATPFMVLLAGFQLLLARHTGQEDVSVGLPVAGRNRVELEGVIGFFVNTLVLRTDLAGPLTFQDLLAQVRESALEVYLRQEVPFERIVEDLAPARSLDREPLFQVMFAFQSGPVAERLEMRGLSASPFGAGSSREKFDLTFTLRQGDEGFFGALSYRLDLFDAVTIDRMLARFRVLLRSIVDEPNGPIRDLTLLPGHEIQQVLREWGGIADSSGEASTLHGLVRAQAQRAPDAPAAIFEGASLTYQELERRAGGLARQLVRLGVGPEVRVGICSERSLEMIVGLLGILKAGGAYVPLDPGYPDARLAMLLEDAGASVLLAQSSLRERLRSLAGPQAHLVDLGEAAEERGSVGFERSGVGPDNAAYVIFTSGSTGRPKGAINTHGAIVNRLLWMQKAYGLDSQDRVLHKTPFSFDVSVWELFWPLLTGAVLVVARPEGHRDAGYLARIIESESISHVHFVPSMLRAFLEQTELTGCEGLRRVRRLRRVIASGEALPLDLASEFHDRLGVSGVELHNLYGPTEAAVDVTCHACLPGEDRVPIGRPVDGVSLRLLDRAGLLVPIGVPGELHIGGVQVARGYQGRADLTAERFVPDPLGEPGDRLYKTGDLVRQLPGGELEYLGRIDQQVKLRGFRIELGEIEAVLVGHSQVREAVVVAKGGRLISYLVPERGMGITLEEIRGLLRSQLPEYMVPTAWVVLDRLPLSPNGKLDRRALPEPEAAAVEEHVAPRGEIEELIALVWSEVLERPFVGATEDFFSLGGHSLLVMKVASRLRRALGVELPLRMFFEAPTVSALAVRVERALRGESATRRPPVTAAPRTGPLPLSFAQQRLWFLDQLEPDNPQYNMSSALRFLGPLKITALQAAFNAVVDRHEVLRTTFPVLTDVGRENGEPVQVVAPAVGWRLPRVDLSSLPEGLRNAEVWRLTRREAVQPFNLARGPVLRTTLLELGASEYVLLTTLHHIASDGWSMDLLVRELGLFYEAAVSREPSPLPPLPIQYGDYAVWQRQWLSGEVLQSELAFWRERLGDVSEVLDLPTDRSRSAAWRHTGASWSFVMPERLSAALLALARHEGATPFMVLLAGFQALLFRITGQPGIRVGTPVAGRSQLETEGLIGFFINTLVLRAVLAGTMTFGELLAQVREATLESYAHQDLPFDRLVQELQPERQLSRMPLFQAAFGFQAISGSRKDPIPGLRIEVLDAGAGSAKFDLNLSVLQNGSVLTGSIAYDADLFDSPTVGRMASHLLNLFEAVVTGPGLHLGELPLLAEGERHQLTTEWSDSASTYERDGCVHDLFRERVEQTPDAEALVFGAERLTYGQLEQRSNRLAHHLRGLGVGPEVRVGLLLERSADLVVAMLAVLKAGGAYVPLDPSYPRERLELLADEATLALVVSTEDMAGWRLDAHPDTPPEVKVDAEGLAYVLFTSGSTGTPKGVAVNHRAILRLVRNTDYIRLTSGDRVAQASNASFDAVTFEIWGALLNGATLVGLPREVVLSSRALGDQLGRDKIDVLFLTTALFHQLAAEAPEALLSVRHLLFGGEAVDPLRVRSLLASGGPQRLLHVYGPTESTTFAIWHRVEAVPEGASTIPIGRPIANTSLYVVDPEIRPIPVGVVGELCLGGDGLARGYLNRPDLTAERFVPNPFAGQPGERLYRTGDLCRMRASGELEFLGRADTQVKVRGFRIELAEVESVLSSHPEVKEAVVVAREEARGAGRRLVAYIVPASGAQAGARELRSFVRERLPDYMIPAVFATLTSLPLTPSGKVDRRALPAPDPASYGAEMEENGAAPRNEIEELVAAVWADVLHLPQVGMNDDFFELGGHSLLAAQVAARVRDTFGVDLPLRVLFDSPTVAGMAREVEVLLRSDRNDHAPPPPPLTPVPRSGPLPLSFAQQRLWFFDRLEPDNSAYNIAAAQRLTGPLDAGILAASFAEVVRRHEVLRTTYQEVEEQAVQVVASPGPLELPIVDLAGLPEVARDREAQRLARQEAGLPFDLAGGPVVRTHLLRLGREDHAVLMTVHHIAGDGWSLGILVGELGRIYSALLAGAPSPLPELPLQYADYAVWQRGWMRGEILEAELSYWRRQLGGAPALDLPTDRPRPSAPSRRGASVPLTLGPALSEALEALSRAQGATPFMLLLAAFQLLLSRHAGQEDVSVGSPVAGRGRVELERLIGFFVNTLVLRTDLSGWPSFPDLLRRVRETVLEAHLHQEVPFERLVEELATGRSLDRDPLFQAMFSFQSMPVAERLEVPGVAAARLDVGGGGWEPFDLTLILRPSPSGFSGSLSYRTDLFDAPTMERMAARLRRLLEEVASGPECPVPDLPMLTGEELRQLQLWSGTEIPSAGVATLHGLFEDQARRSPEAMAVSCEGGGLSYRELDRKAAALAQHLRSQGVGPEVRVGICGERSLELIVGVLGILKAGGVYVPLDPGYPDGRLAILLEDADAALVLVQASLRQRLQSLSGERPRFVDLGEATAPGSAGDSRPSEVNPANAANAAYVIFTSGSTGRPKGVVVTHGAITSRLLWGQRTYGLTPDDRMLHKAPLGFDVSVWEIFSPLIAGACLVMARPGGHQDSPYLVETIAREGITQVDFVPSLLRVFLEEPGLERFTRLRRVVVGGEALPSDLARQFHLRLGEPLGVELVNLYGPTETAVDATHHLQRPGRQETPIGRPVDGLHLHLMDSQGGLVPVGAAGELYIGGAQVARGYLGRPDLTAERFVPDPFGEPGSRLYRTGDLVRYLPDGALEFLGRVDHQVKLRGVRIELEEVEATLRRHPSVRDAAVVLDEQAHGGPRLVAGVVPAAEATLGVDDLQHLLRRELPQHMVPSAFALLEALPLTPNRKLDRQALAAALRDTGVAAGSLAPRDPVELALARIAGEILGMPEVGVRDDFFSLGGHSLLAVRFLARVRRQFGIDLPLSLLFRSPTVESLAAALRRRGDTDRISSLVEIQANGDERPLFCIHPVGGNVLCYLGLARSLGPHERLYGLQSLPDAGRYRTIEEMAEAYLREIRTVQPHGPLRLAGWSMGGVIAYEMACQVLEQGEDAPALVLLDSASPGHPAYPRDQDDSALAASFARDLWGLGGVALHDGDVAGLGSGDSLAQLLRAVRRQDLLPPDLEEQDVRRWFEVFKRNHLALTSYRARRYSGRLVLVRAAATASMDPDGDLGWGRLVEPGAIEVHTLAGHHYDLLREPGVAGIAGILKGIFARG